MIKTQHKQQTETKTETHTHKIKIGKTQRLTKL